MESIIRNLIDVLEAAEQAGASLNDSVLRDAMLDVITRGFVEQESGYQVPADLLLNYTEAAAKQNDAVVKAFDAFLKSARKAAAAQGLDTPDSRADAFFESEVESSSGETNVLSFFE